MQDSVHQSTKPLRQHQGKVILATTFLALCAFAVVFIATPNMGNSNDLDRLLAKKTQLIEDFDIIKTYDRNGDQFYTQGLIFADKDTLIESTGLYKKSRMQYLKLSDMSVTKSSRLDDKYFGEGCELHTVSGKNKIYQLTWKERKILVWNADTLKLEKSLTMPSAVTEGWGLTKSTVTINGKATTVFYFSDGTSNIYQVNADTMKVLKTIRVKKYSGTAVSKLNELEMVNGKIWANIYRTTQIAVIDPSTGYVDYMIELGKLETLAKAKVKSLGLSSLESGNVLNGIAYDEANDRLIVTGKMWPLMWQIKVKGI